MTIKTDEKISYEDYQKLTSDERKAYHAARAVRLEAAAAAMPTEVWLEPSSKEAEFYGEDQPAGTFSYYACDESGNVHSVKYVRADTLRGAAAELVKVRAELAAYPLLEESDTVRGELPPPYKPPVYNQ